MEYEYQLARHLRKVLHLDCESKMQWVSVEDRLPDQPEEIIDVERYWCALECGLCELVTFAHTTSGYHEFIWNDCICSKITHWMPLPKPPGEE